MKIPFAAVPFLAAAASLCMPRTAASDATGTAPLPGPGGVIVAAHALVRAIDARDADALRAVLAEYPHGGGYCATVAANGEIREREDDSTLCVVDVDASGTLLRARSLDAAVRTLGGEICARDATVQTTIRSVRADCPSEGCSWGSLELERRHTAGGRVVVQPLHATILVRWVGGEGSAMKAYHWHCAPAGPSRVEPAARETKEK